jgi:hypothetical protein
VRPLSLPVMTHTPKERLNVSNSAAILLFYLDGVPQASSSMVSFCADGPGRGLSFIFKMRLAGCSRTLNRIEEKETTTSR